MGKAQQVTSEDFIFRRKKILVMQEFIQRECSDLSRAEQGFLKIIAADHRDFSGLIGAFLDHDYMQKKIRLTKEVLYLMNDAKDVIFRDEKLLAIELFIHQECRDLSWLERLFWDRFVPWFPSVAVFIEYMCDVEYMERNIVGFKSLVQKAAEKVAMEDGQVLKDIRDFQQRPLTRLWNGKFRWRIKLP